MTLLNKDELKEWHEVLPAAIVMSVCQDSSVFLIQIVPLSVIMNPG